mmetsp:Transcript_3611/g.8045  ORF Transcript_3611/g.8045 Transcript_3611/m.8045 type:complete len:221 (-) Transcript_3611:38-700(-)
MGKVTLVWHPPAKRETSRDAVEPGESNTPVSVQGWFEMGSRFRTKIVQPRFVWRETYQPSLNQRKLGMSCRSPEALDILSIMRVLEPTSVDRSEFPFIKIDRCFSVTSSGGHTYLFEASTAAQRDWFVSGLKLVVARLASMVIVGDSQMFAEFFSPWAHSPMLDSSGTSSNTEESSGSSKADSSFGTGAAPPRRKLFVSTTDADRENLWGTASSPMGKKS